MDPKREFIALAWSNASAEIIRKEIDSQSIILGTNRFDKNNEEKHCGFKFRVLTPIHPQLQLIF